MTAASPQMSSSIGGVSGMPVSSARMSVMPTGAGVMIQGGDAVPMPPPIGPPTGQVLHQSCTESLPFMKTRILFHEQTLCLS